MDRLNSVKSHLSLPSICTTNCRSLKNKVDELKLFLGNMAPDIVCLTETWLDDSIGNDFVSFSNFSAHRADRSTSKKGGGVCCLVSNLFKSVTLVHKSDNEDVEILLVRAVCNVFDCIIVTLYFPHGSSLNLCRQQQACEYVISTIDHALQRFFTSNVIIAGDFNNLKPDSFVNCFCLQNVVTLPTRKNAVLDLVLLPDNLVPYYKPCEIYPPLSSSDHDIVLIKPMQKLASFSSFVKVMDLRKSNIVRVSAYLNSINWSILFHELSLDKICELFYHHLHESLYKLPVNYVKRSNNDPPWMTNVVKVLINKRYQAYRQKDWRLYAHYKEKVKTAIFIAKRSWGNQLLKEGKSVWDVYQKVRAETKDSNDWLLNCKPDSDISTIIEDLKTMIISNFVKSDIKELIPLPYIVPFECEEAVINTMLHQVNPKKSPGSDNIPSIVWSKFADSLSKPLSMIFNICMQTANIPQLWKNADVSPLPKSSPPSLNNVRPISLLPIPERLFEKYLIKKIGDQFFAHIDSKQFAYRPKSSTVCALLELENYIKTILQKKCITACHVVSVDLMKGFDRISHQLLIKKMINVNFDNFMISFMQNYLKNRFIRIRWRNKHSSYERVTSGIPQGSSLGPIIFAFFVSDLRINEKSNSLLLKYADDVIIAGEIHNNDVVSVASKNYSEVIQWTHNNEMNIQEDKCQQMFVAFNRGTTSIDHDKLKVPKLRVKNTLKILGVILDEKLKFNLHIEHICKKSSSRLYILRQLKDYLPRNELLLIYQNCIRSVLEYGAPLFVNLSTGLSNDIERIQRRAHIIICGSRECTCNNFIPLDYRRIVIGFKLFQSIMADKQHPLHHLLLPTLPTTGQFRLPLSSSSHGRSFMTCMSKMFNSGFSLA